MKNREQQIIQCLSCGRIKTDVDVWIDGQIDPIKHNISHTYCRECINILQKKLLASRDFHKWDFSEKILHLRTELDKHTHKHDRRSLRNYLEEFYCVSESDFENFYQELKERLVPAVCPFCHMEVKQSEKLMFLSKLQMHRKCYNDLSQKIQIILDNNWDKSNRLDAYLDLLRVEKNLRPTVKQEISKQRFSIGEPA